MPDIYNPESPSGRNLTPWKFLLGDAEEKARSIVDEILEDPLLSDSIAYVTSSHAEQRTKLEEIRKQFAAADSQCSKIRNDVRQLMQANGFHGEWGEDDIRAIDEQIIVYMREAAYRAATINKQRAQASTLENQLLAQAIEEVVLCCSIAVLRNIDDFSGEGEAFCVIYLATAILREKKIRDVAANRATSSLADWLQYATGIKKRAAGFDILTHSHIAAGICKNMGIASTDNLRQALVDAVETISKIS